MTEHNRRISARLATALAIVSLSLALPAATLAGHRDVGARPHDGRHHPSQRVEHRRGYGRYDRHDRHRPQRGFGYGWGNHHRPRPYRVHLHGSSCGHRQSSYGYYCQPCGQRYGSFDRLSHHVHQVHHIPFWKLPFVIFAKAMGHYYYG
jgi:hypothetical protein